MIKDDQKSMGILLQLDDISSKEERKPRIRRDPATELAEWFVDAMRIGVERGNTRKYWTTGTLRIQKNRC